MILQEGKTQEELMQVLQEMDELTSMDSIVKNEEKLVIDCERENGRLKNWTISFDPKFKRKPISAGTTYNRFLSALENMQKEDVLFDTPDCVVLCYLSTAPHKNWNGDIISYWAEIEPGLPYQVAGGEIKFQTKEIIMDETDFAILSETGLAFYCKTTGVYYPITETAYFSFGKFLDSAMAFRDVESHLLGTALVIAEKISKLPELRLIYRHKNDYIRPVMSVVGNKYKLFSQKLFFETILSHAATKLGIYEVSNWVVEDTKTSLSLEYSNLWEDFYFKVTFMTGDTPAVPFLASLEAICGNAAIPLLANKAKHTKSFTKERVPELLNGIPEKMEEFRRLYHVMQGSVCYFDSSWLADIHKALGKKRVAELDPIASGCYPAIDIWNLVIKTRYIQIPWRQTIDLKKGFHDLFYQIMNHLEDEQATA